MNAAWWALQFAAGFLVPVAVFVGAVIWLDRP